MKTLLHALYYLRALEGFEPPFPCADGKRPIQRKMRCVRNKAHILNSYHKPSGICSLKITLTGIKTESLDKKLDHRKGSWRKGGGGGASGCSQQTFHFVTAHTSAKPKEMLLSFTFFFTITQKNSLNDKIRNHIGFYPGAVIRASLQGP